MGVEEWGWEVEMGELDRKMRMGDGDGGMCMEKGIGEMRMIGKCCWEWEMEMDEIWR